jgi:hypothetical protein
MTTYSINKASDVNDFTSSRQQLVLYALGSWVFNMGGLGFRGGDLH